MPSRKLLSLIVTAAALAAGAAPAVAAPPPQPAPPANGIIAVLIGLEAPPHPSTCSSLQMPGASTWGSLTSGAPSGCDR